MVSFLPCLTSVEEVLIILQRTKLDFSVCHSLARRCLQNNVDSFMADCELCDHHLVRASDLLHRNESIDLLLAKKPTNQNISKSL